MAQHRASSWAERGLEWAPRKLSLEETHESRTAPAEFTTAEFERRLRQLSRSEDLMDNPGCVECRGCSHCARCTFCRDSEYLVGCHYCVSSERCTDCLHCTGCRRSIACHHCVQCEDCSACRYLSLCTAMAECTYCFGCVGLHGKDFHILNEPYEQKEYFRITARLARELGLSR